MITKLQQGGQMEQQLVQLVQAAMSGDQQATQQIDQIMQAAKKGDQKAIQLAQYIQTIAQKLQGSRKARLGAKLNYYNYLKKGGTICPTCPKYQQGGNYQKAWNQARARGHRYFWYNGRTYNTKKINESDQYWADHFIDNLTTGGSDRVQTDAGLTAGWQGQKGANIGRYNSKGKWIKAKTNKFKGQIVLGARGDDTSQSDTRVFGRADRPTEVITISNHGTERGHKTSNYSTGVVVGGKHPKVPYRYPKYGSTNLYNYLQGGYKSKSGGTFVDTPITPKNGKATLPKRFNFGLYRN